MVPVAAVPVTNTIVETREASVPSGVKSATMKSAKSSVETTTAMESTAAVKSTKPSVKSAKSSVESTSAVKTSAPAMWASIDWV